MEEEFQLLGACLMASRKTPCLLGGIGTFKKPALFYEGS